MGPYSGSVKKVNLKVGDKVSEGSSILIIGSEEEKPDEQIEEEVKEIKEETIIQKPPEKVISKPKEIIKNNRVSVFKSSKALASPKTRKFARELGVDINNVTGSERSGRIIEEDIKKKVEKVEREKKKAQKKCLESAGDGLGTLIGEQKAPKHIIATRLRLFHFFSVI